MANIIIYNTDDGQTNVKLYANDGTVWLTPTQMAELFDCTRPNVAAHIRSIYSEGELDKAATRKKYLQVQTEGKMYEKFAARRRHAEAVQADIDDMAELEKELPNIKGRNKTDIG